MKWQYFHCYDVIMGAIVSQITSLYSTVYSEADQSKHQSSASLAFVQEIHRGPVNFPHKWPVTRKMFPFDDVIMSEVTSNIQSHLFLTAPFDKYISRSHVHLFAVTWTLTLIAMSDWLFHWGHWHESHRGAKTNSIYWMYFVPHNRWWLMLNDNWFICKQVSTCFPDSRASLSITARIRILALTGKYILFHTHILLHYKNKCKSEFFSYN